LRIERDLTRDGFNAISPFFGRSRFVTTLNMQLDEIIKKAKDLNSYFITITTKDKDKEVGDLEHYVFRKEFSFDDVPASLDDSVRSMGVSLEKPVDVITPPKRKVYPTLKMAIISHFNRMPQSYSPARAVKNQIKILKENGHDVCFFVQEGSPLTETGLGCTVKAIIPKFKREKMVINEDAKGKLIDVFREELTGNYDCVITHDFFIQDTITFSEAIKECGVKIPWLHFARSGVAHPMDFSMPNARFVYLNKNEIGKFARAIKVEPSQCRAVFNEKDPSFMFNFHPTTRMIIHKFQLWERDIIMTYPVCSTRLDAKGINSIIKIFVELKRLGNKVCLIVPNANGRKRTDDLKNRQAMAKELGLNEDEFILTSTLHTEEHKTESELPNQVCAELMQMSNLFIAASEAEVGPNVLLEACMAKNLIVVNEDLPLNYDFVDKKNVLSHPFTSHSSLHYSGRDEKSLVRLARKINGQIKTNKADQTFRQVWRTHNSEAIYGMLMDVIVELIDDYKNNKL